MEELFCEECNCSIGFISNTGPHGFVLCERCYEESLISDDQELLCDTSGQIEIKK